MSETTRDEDLRALTHKAIDTSGMWRRDEVGVGRGSAIVDVLATNGKRLFGYEIKSSRDTLHRLPVQCAVYETAFDFTTLVCDPKHVRAADRIIPKHWGIVLVRRMSDGSLDYDSIRPASENPNVHSAGLFSLIWRDELLVELERLDLAKGVRGAKRKMEERYLAHKSIIDLREFVCARIMSRD